MYVRLRYYSGVLVKMPPSVIVNAIFSQWLRDNDHYPYNHLNRTLGGGVSFKWLIVKQPGNPSHFFAARGQEFDGQIAVKLIMQRRAFPLPAVVGLSLIHI